MTGFRSFACWIDRPCLASVADVATIVAATLLTSTRLAFSSFLPAYGSGLLWPRSYTPLNRSVRGHNSLLNRHLVFLTIFLLSYLLFAFILRNLEGSGHNDSRKEPNEHTEISILFLSRYLLSCQLTHLRRSRTTITRNVTKHFHILPAFLLSVGSHMCCCYGKKSMWRPL